MGESKNADELAKATIELLSPMKDYIKTITADNGKEFAPMPRASLWGGVLRTEHQKIAEKLGIDFFFAHPYHSWERGLSEGFLPQRDALGMENEYTNKLIRQYIHTPKGIPLGKISFIN